MMRPMFHIVAINERTGAKTYVTAAPVTHAEGCAWLKKFTNYSWRRMQLEPVDSIPMRNTRDLDKLMGW